MVCPWDMFPNIRVSTLPVASSAYNGLTLSSVSISAAIIAPSIIIAFNLQNIEDFINKHRNVRTVSARPGSAGLGSAGLGTVISGGGGIAQDADGKKKQKLIDEEQGRKSANSSF
jgi:hypothetical protein